jgi:peptidoglycan/LPS O-acetylase OafA/YrhL
LVAGSLERSKTLLTFLGLRVIRIYPALVVEVALSAFLIGTAVTTLPLASYFRDPLFLSYLLNVTGTIHYYLPGVFESNPWPQVVNMQLWTVPYELLCYVTITALALLGAVQRRILIPLAMSAVALADLLLRLHSPDGWRLFTGPELVLCFLAGVLFYLYRDGIAWSHTMFSGALVASIALWFVPFGEYPAVLTISYVTVYLGLTNIRRLSLIRGADYSYGIYLYGFVICSYLSTWRRPGFGGSMLRRRAFPCLPSLRPSRGTLSKSPPKKMRKYLPAAERSA